MNTFFERAAAAFMASTMLFTSVGANNGGSFFNTIATDGSGSTVTDTGYYQPAKFSNFEENNERDTKGTGDDKEYNTSLGLHTDKTVEKVYPDDGRTFDLGLETWYVGENPADVGMVIDGSGSMAWTTNALNPLNVEDALEDDKISIENFKKKYVDSDGYLTEDGVNMILNKSNTDNTRLGYDKYRYYVYENRSTVDEFVPLGYWSGENNVFDPSSLIHSFKFENNVKDSISAQEGTLINHADESSGFNDEPVEQVEQIPSEANISGWSGMDVDKTLNKGAVVLDLELDKLNLENLSISFEANLEEIIKNETTGNQWVETPLIYIGYVDTPISGENYYTITRGAKTTPKDTNSGDKIKFNTTGSNGNGIISGRFNTSSYDNYRQKTHLFNINTGTNAIRYYTTATPNSSGNTTSGTITNTLNFGENAGVENPTTGKIRIVVAGNVNGVTGTDTDYSDIAIKNLKVFDKSITSAAIARDAGVGTDGLIAYYTFDGTSNGLINQASGTGAKAHYIHPATAEKGFDTTDLMIGAPEIVYDSDGYNGSGSSINVTKTGNNAAVDLGGIIENSSYTLSFAVKRKDDGSASTGENGKDYRSEIMYVGDKAMSGYYNVVREWTSSQSKLKVYEKNDKIKSNPNAVFNRSWHIITYVVDDSKNIKTYKDGVLDTDANSTNKQLTETYSTPINVILAGLKDKNYTGGDILIDDLQVYNKALSEDEVKGMYSWLSGSGSYNNKYAYHDKNPVAEIKNVSEDDPDGWYYVNSTSDWSNVTADPPATGKQYIGLSKETSPTVLNVATVPTEYEAKAKAGDKDYEQLIQSIKAGDTVHNDDNYETDKDNPQNYFVPSKNESIKFYLDSQNNLRCYFGSGGDSESDKVTYDEYDKYINSYDNLRTQCSLVYEKQEGEQIKLETLNDVINGFVDGLQENSERSRIGAVRFSTNRMLNDTTKDNYIHKRYTSTNDATIEEAMKKHLMLDWVSKSDGVTDAKFNGHNLLSPRFGTDSTQSESRQDGGALMYNYLLTGGTNTWVGLKAYYDTLDQELKTLGANNNKYLILFTDGRDTLVDTSVPTSSDNGNSDARRTSGAIKSGSKVLPDGYDKTEVEHDELAKVWADTIKEEGYTIYCVMLSTGSVSPTANTEEYEKAVNFLGTLAGKKDSTAKISEYVYTANNAEELSNAFDNILAQIVSPLTSYTVKDYIDPRFDLVDYTDKTKTEGEVWHLSKGDDGKGKVVKVTNVEGGTEATSEVETVDVNGSEAWVYTPKESHTGPNKNEAYLFYDSEKDMFYLEWQDQDISGATTPIASTDTGKKLDVWKSIITVKAKDDFIGGNTILTNGNEANMNYVFCPEDKDRDDKLRASSGIDRARDVYVEGDNNINADGYEENTPILSEQIGAKRFDYVSKGFPRTTVNVELLKLDAKGLEDKLYLGEASSPADMLYKLEDGVTPSYYLEYLMRYAHHLGVIDSSTSTTDMKQLLDLLNKWLGFDFTSGGGTYGVNKFSIPYVYLPDNNTKNNAGDDETKPADERNNTKDVVGILTYEWQRIISPKYIENNTSSFIIETTKGMQYSLTVKYEPLPENDKDGVQMNFDAKVGVSSDQDKYNYYFVPDSDFNGEDFVTLTSTTGGEPQDRYHDLKSGYKTRSQYIENNLVKDDDYKWNGVEDDTKPVKPTAGKPQVKKSAVGTTYYGDNTECKNDATNGNYLSAKTAYTRDVVSGGLALELRVRGSDLKNIINHPDLNKDIVITAERNYSDPGRGDFYDDPGVTGEKYKLTFTYSTVPAFGRKPEADEVDENRVYSVIYKLTGYTAKDGKKDGSSYWTDGVDTDGDSTSANNTFDLPIGKYTIEYDADNVMSIKESSSDPGKELEYISVERDASAYEPEYFDNNVILGLYDDDEVIKPGDPKIDDEDVIESGEHEINNENIGDYIADSALTEDEGVSTAEFYLGTDKYGNKGEDKAYLNDRLGMIVLYAEQPSLSVSKTVRYGTPYVTNDTKWHFKAEIVYEFENEPDSTQISECDNKVAGINNAILYDAENPEGTTVSTGSGDESIWTGFVKDAGSSIGNKLVYKTDMYLKHRQRLEINDIPTVTGASVKYNVTEILDVAGLDEDAKEALEVHRVLDDGHEDIIKPMDSVDAPSITDEELVFGSSEDIVNEFPAYALPGTGGRGVYGIMLAGGFMMIISLGLLYLRKRREYRA